jgi:hypothetical protein
MSFGCGVLISAVAYDLLEDGYQEGGIWPIVVGAIAGSAAYALADWAVCREGALSRKRSGDQQVNAGEGGGLAIAVGSLLDGIPESVVGCLAERASASRCSPLSFCPISRKGFRVRSACGPLAVRPPTSLAFGPRSRSFGTCRRLGSSFPGRCYPPGHCYRECDSCGRSSHDGGEHHGAGSCRRRTEAGRRACCCRLAGRLRAFQRRRNVEGRWARSQ